MRDIENPDDLSTTDPLTDDERVSQTAVALHGLQRASHSIGLTAH